MSAIPNKLHFVSAIPNKLPFVPVIPNKLPFVSAILLKILREKGTKFVPRCWGGGGGGGVLFENFRMIGRSFDKSRKPLIFI